MTTQAPFRLGYCRSLDGLRGVAVLLVLLDHGDIIGTSFGFMGVNTFFVLSGFLITCLLIGEYDQSNTISFRHFYLRRALRLLPALVTMLTVFVIFVFFTDPYKRAVRELFEALRALFYVTNWAGIFRIGRNLSLSHTWSLAIEEQFYFTWPLLLLFLLRRSSRQSLLCWIFLGVFLSVLTRILLTVGGTDSFAGNIYAGINPGRLGCGTDTRADSLLLGCFAGVCVSSNLRPKKNWFKRAFKISAILSTVSLVFLARVYEYAPKMIYAGWFFESICAAVLITYLVTTSGGYLHLLFENPGLVYLGRISYGLYVWHYPILIAMKQHHLPWQNLAYLIPVLVVVLLSYYLIEKPCLRLKSRFSAVA